MSECHPFFLCHVSLLRSREPDIGRDEARVMSFLSLLLSDPDSTPPDHHPPVPLKRNWGAFTPKLSIQTTSPGVNGPTICLSAACFSITSAGAACPPPWPYVLAPRASRFPYWACRETPTQTRGPSLNTHTHKKKEGKNIEPMPSCPLTQPGLPARAVVPFKGTWSKPGSHSCQLVQDSAHTQ